MKKLVADVWGCGDICNCWYCRIRQFEEIPEEDRKGSSSYWRWNIKDLWEGQWMNDWPQTPAEKEEFEEVREEFREACIAHEIDIDLSSNSQWDWKAKEALD